ncbi:MAG: nucleotidyltransferase domain-containing protein [Bacteroides sp.]|nr:nucleotidyltransferase domain-containing protein [Ruminococcus flavefaciens]MCM1555062.1 nucleotidyltransferase domain-containing protein [Bacteroides sp.]MCM1555487.1 nucleotidyltransferase domain-containing protein [Bacteroides sp.]
MSDYKRANSQKYGILEMGLFGSQARAQSTEKSDIDVCILLSEPSFFVRFDIQCDLEKLFGCKVDVISLRANMRPAFKEELEKDAIYV